MLGRVILYGLAGLLIGVAVIRVATATPHPADTVIVRVPAPPP